MHRRIGLIGPGFLVRSRSALILGRSGIPGARSIRETGVIARPSRLGACDASLCIVPGELPHASPTVGWHGAGPLGRHVGTRPRPTGDDPEVVAATLAHPSPSTRLGRAATSSAPVQELEKRTATNGQWCASPHRDHVGWQAFRWEPEQNGSGTVPTRVISRTPAPGDHPRVPGMPSMGGPVDLWAARPSPCRHLRSMSAEGEGWGNPARVRAPCFATACARCVAPSASFPACDGVAAFPRLRGSR